MKSSTTEVVDITDDKEIVVHVSNYKLELEGVPQAQARPRLGKYGFYNPGSKDVATLKAKIKGGISNPPIFSSSQPVVVNVYWME